MAKNNHYNKKYYRQRDKLNLLIAETLAAFAKERNIKTVLDVGCGTGRLVKFLNTRRFKAKGCDPEKEAIKIARNLNNPKLIIKADANKLPFKNNSFDLVCAISVIEHLKKSRAEEFIKESNRILKRGGCIFLITPNFNSPFRLLFGRKWFAYSDPTHINFFKSSSISSLLEKNGFKNISFQFKAPKNIRFYWHFQTILKSLPTPFVNAINYSLISSPLALYRDSIWVSAEK